MIMNFQSNILDKNLAALHVPSRNISKSFCLCVCLGIPSCLFFLSFSSHLGEDYLLEESSLECSFVTNSLICCDAATNTRSLASSSHSHGSGSHGCPRPSKNSFVGTQFLETCQDKYCRKFDFTVEGLQLQTCKRRHTRMYAAARECKQANAVACRQTHPYKKN